MEGIKLRQTLFEIDLGDGDDDSSMSLLGINVGICLPLVSLCSSFISIPFNKVFSQIWSKPYLKLLPPDVLWFSCCFCLLFHNSGKPLIIVSSHQSGNIVQSTKKIFWKWITSKIIYQRLLRWRQWREKSLEENQDSLLTQQTWTRKIWESCRNISSTRSILSGWS